jgi:hypothetical protein
MPARQAGRFGLFSDLPFVENLIGNFVELVNGRSGAVPKKTSDGPS